MSSKPENVFRTSVHRLLNEQVYHMKTHNPYLAGVPDDWYSAGGGDMWIEYKFLVLPKRIETSIDIAGMLTALQRDWLLARYAEGRRVGVIVGCRQGGVVFEGTSWETTLTNKEFQERLSTRAEVARWIESTIGVV